MSPVCGSSVIGEGFAFHCEVQQVKSIHQADVGLEEYSNNEFILRLVKQVMDAFCLS